MTKRSRTLLFTVLTLTFLVATPAIIFYSQGYRFDIASQRLSQVGAFYFRVHPARAEILIESESAGHTSRFVGDILSKNLLPQTYHIAIKKDGYHAWEKSLEIFPKQVTEAKDITLFPTDITFITAQEQVQNFWAVPNNREFLLQKKSADASWELVLWDTENNTEHTLFEPQNPQDELWGVEWASDSNAFLLQLVSREAIKTFVQEINREAVEEGNLIPLSSLEPTAAQIHLSTSDPNRVFFLAAASNGFNLFELNYKEIEPPQLVATDVSSFAFFKDELFWLDKEGTMWNKQNSQESLTEVSHEESELLKEIVFGDKETLISPDHKKLAISGKGEILLFFLEEDSEQPTRRKGERIFLTRLSQDITHMQWLNSHYLLFAIEDTIRISEIDTRDRINIIDVGNFPSPRFFWQDSKSTLYVYSQNQIKASAKFWP